MVKTVRRLIGFEALVKRGRDWATKANWELNQEGALADLFALCDLPRAEDSRCGDLLKVVVEKPIISTQASITFNAPNLSVDLAKALQPELVCSWVGRVMNEQCTVLRPHPEKTGNGQPVPCVPMLDFSQVESRVAKAIEEACPPPVEPVVPVEEPKQPRKYDHIFESDTDGFFSVTEQSSIEELAIKAMQAKAVYQEAIDRLMDAVKDRLNGR